MFEEARQDEDENKQDQCALPVIRQQRWHLVRDPAFLEMPRQDGKAHQQQEQVRKNDPFVLEMAEEPNEACAELEAGEGELVGNDGDEAAERDGQRVTVEHRNAEQRQPEQDEVDRDSEDKDGIDQGSLGAGEGESCPPLSENVGSFNAVT